MIGEPGEEWRAVVGWPDYLVSDWGRVWSVRTRIFLQPIINPKGYHRIMLRSPGKRRWYFVHVLVADAFFENSNGREVNHRDGDKSYNDISNLEWNTRSQNIKHSFDIGIRKPSGGLRPHRIRIIETDEVFDSISACARHINGNSGNITNCLAGRQHKHRGYHFEYLED